MSGSDSRGKRSTFAAQSNRTRVDDRAADDGSVSGQPLGGGVDHDVGTPFDRSTEIRGGHRAVHDQRDAGVVRDSSEALEVDDVVLRVGDRLGVDRSGSRRDRLDPLLIGGLFRQEVEHHALPGHAAREQLLRALVEAGGGEDAVALLDEREDRDRDGGLTAADDDPAEPALEIGEATAREGVRRVLGAGNRPGPCSLRRSGPRPHRRSGRRIPPSDTPAPLVHRSPHRASRRHGSGGSRSPVRGSWRERHRSSRHANRAPMLARTSPTQDATHIEPPGARSRAWPDHIEVMKSSTSTGRFGWELFVFLPPT